MLSLVSELVTVVGENRPHLTDFSMIKQCTLYSEGKSFNAMNPRTGPNGKMSVRCGFHPYISKKIAKKDHVQI